MGRTFQVITRTLSLVRASSTSGKFIHDLTRKRTGCCCGADWCFSWASFLCFFCSLLSFRFWDTASCSGVSSRALLSSIAGSSLFAQIRGQADARRANRRARENSVDLVFGCLRSRARIPLPLTVTDADTTCGAIGQGDYLGSGTMHLLRRTVNSSLFLRRWAPRTAQKLSPSRQPCPPQFGLSAFPISRAFATHSMTNTSPQSFSSPDLPNKFGNFDLIRSEKLGLADIVVSKYRSRETGLTVVHLDYEGL